MIGEETRFEGRPSTQPYEMQSPQVALDRGCATFRVSLGNHCSIACKRFALVYGKWTTMMMRGHRLPRTLGLLRSSLQR